MWVDREGHYHIVSHNGDRGVNNLPANASGDCGRHFFSVASVGSEILRLEGDFCDNTGDFCLHFGVLLTRRISVTTLGTLDGLELRVPNWDQQ